MSRPAVTVLALGGTIASTAGPNGGASPALDVDELLATLPGSSRALDIAGRSLQALPSAHLTVTDVVALAREVTAAVAAGATGVVVTQGTDTLEDTAFLLDLWVADPTPVVVTGALRHPGLPGADGPANLAAAVTVAAAAVARGLGTLVVLNDEIHAARLVTKAHASNPSAFVSYPGALGWLSEGRPRLVLRPQGRAPHLAPVPGARHRVGVVTLGMGDDGAGVRALVASGMDGLVVEALGGGHVPPEALGALSDAAARFPVVVTSTTRHGEVLRGTYDYAGSEVDLADRGIVAGGWLDARKARLLLVALLRAGADRARVAAMFADPYR